MDMYLVNPSFMEQDIMDLVFEKCPNIGVLVAYNHKGHIEKVIKQGFKKVMIDSGAFFTFQKGGTIDIDELTNFYISLEKEYPEIDFTFVALDVIGDESKGYKTLANWQYMNEKVKCIPTFHFGDDWELLDIYVKNSDYVALGGLVPIKSNAKKLTSFLSKVFNKYPKHKFHLFGINSIPVIKKYHIYSVDASTWLGGGKFGKLVTEYGEFYVAANCKTKLSIFNAEKYGVTKLLAEYGIPYPLPEGFNLQKINYINICSLYEQLVNSDKQIKTVYETEFF